MEVLGGLIRVGVGFVSLVIVFLFYIYLIRFIKWVGRKLWRLVCYIWISDSEKVQRSINESINKLNNSADKQLFIMSVIICILCVGYLSWLIGDIFLEVFR